MNQPPLAGHVEYRGYVPADEREALFKGAQAFVLPSFDEGFGIPALEAMSAGVPVVVSNRGALPEVVGDAGLLDRSRRSGKPGGCAGAADRRPRSARDLRAPRPRPRAAIHLGPDGARRAACLRRRAARAAASHARPRRRTSRAFTVEMRIGIDARELCGKPTGVGRHLSGLLGAWSTDAAASRHTFVLYAHRDTSRRRFANAELRVIPGSPGTAWEQLALPKAAKHGPPGRVLRARLHGAAAAEHADRRARARHLVCRASGMVPLEGRAAPAAG